MNFTAEIQRNRKTTEYNQDIVVLQDVSIENNNYGNFDSFPIISMPFKEGPQIWVEQDSRFFG